VGSAINNNGVVAGYFQDTNGVVHGFLYSGGRFTQIDVPGALATGLSAINDSDDLVGIMFPPTGTQPFVGVPVH
jgi:probable HAF family extracellular repeat protein